MIQAICLVFDRVSRNTYELNCKNKYDKFDTWLIREFHCETQLKQHLNSLKIFEVLEKQYVIFTGQMEQTIAYKQ